MKAVRPLLSAVLVVVMAGGCMQHREPAKDPRSEAFTLRPPSSMPGEFQWRQRVTARWPTGTQAFEAVLQKRAGELTLVGLSPMGLPGFVITLRADGTLQFDNRMRRDPPFDPRHILEDVQRVFFPWLVAPVAPDGHATGSLDATCVDEARSAGRLATRSFSFACDGQSDVVVRYDGWHTGNDAPDRAVLEHVKRGYTLTIETLTQQRL